MHFKTFLTALIINCFGIILAMIIFCQYAAEYFYNEYSDSLFERVLINAKNVDSAFQSVYREVLDISFDEDFNYLLNQNDNEAFKILAARLKE